MAKGAGAGEVWPGGEQNQQHPRRRGFCWLLIALLAACLPKPAVLHRVPTVHISPVLAEDGRGGDAQPCPTPAKALSCASGDREVQNALFEGKSCFPLVSLEAFSLLC